MNWPAAAPRVQLLHKPFDIGALEDLLASAQAQLQSAAS